MAKAKAHCTCEVCGKQFERTHTCGNRRDADSWTQWAESNFTLCSSCYAKKKEQEEKDAGLIAKIRLGNPYESDIKMLAVLYGDVYPIKDQVKEIGDARFCDDYPNSDDIFTAPLPFVLSRPKKRWTITFGQDAFNEVLSRLKALGFSITYPTKDDINTWATIHQQYLSKQEEKCAEDLAKEQEKKNKIASALAELGPQPELPDWFKQQATGKRWNGTIYGRSGHYNIYLSGEQLNLTDAQAKELQKAVSEREQWYKKEQAIKHG